MLFTMTLLALLILSAIVVDLGLLRAERREGQSAADVSALAAGSWLSGRNAASAVSRPRSACEAAFGAAKANIGSLSASSTIDCTSLPTNAATCTNTTVPVTVTATGTAPYTFEVTYPVSAASINQTSFTGGVGVATAPSASA
ncbi:MAG: hypothetical protein R2695_06120 [Acidimicrobiales bacterium]